VPDTEITIGCIICLLTSFELLCKTTSITNGCVRQVGGLNGVMRYQGCMFCEICYIISVCDVWWFR